MSWLHFSFDSRLPTPADALPGRAEPIPWPMRHAVNRHPMSPPYPDGSEVATLALGCFWGAERDFWRLPGVLVTGVGYTGGSTPNPTYGEVCGGRTGHAEAVQVVFDPTVIVYEDLLRTFWESHDPTQGMRQGNDHGTQYRSAIFVHDEAQRVIAEASRAAYQRALRDAGHGRNITTEITAAGPFYVAEEYHQQYLHKNPDGYCGIGGSGVACPVGLVAR